MIFYRVENVKLPKEIFSILWVFEVDSILVNKNNPMIMNYRSIVLANHQIENFIFLTLIPDSKKAGALYFDGNISTLLKSLKSTAATPDTPVSCINTPYKISISDMVALLCVTIINCES